MWEMMLVAGVCQKIRWLLNLAKCWIFIKFAKMTSAVEILQEFFSPSSREKVWVMPEADNYTKIVREWSPVQASEYGTIIDFARSNVKIPPTNPMWRPNLSNSRETDISRRYGHEDRVPSPVGTDPPTCQRELAHYFATRALSGITGSAAPQRVELQRAVIGSFRIYTTVDKINHKEKLGTFNFWMFNSMSKKSLDAYTPDGNRFGMKTQYMWWNWVATFDWKGSVRRVAGWR